MKNRFLLISIFALFFLTNIAKAEVYAVGSQTASQGDYYFTENMSVGTTSPAVLQLQKRLNSDPDTRVAVSGNGSICNETNYFGSATRNAVIKFQKKYDITPAVGFLGVITRNVLNILTENKNSDVFSVQLSSSTKSINVLIPGTASSTNGSMEQCVQVANNTSSQTTISTTPAPQQVSTTSLAYVQSLLLLNPNENQIQTSTNTPTYNFNVGTLNNYKQPSIPVAPITTTSTSTVELGVTDLDQGQVLDKDLNCVNPLRNYSIPVFSITKKKIEKFVWVMGRSQLVDNTGGALVGNLTGGGSGKNATYKPMYSIPETGMMLVFVLGNDTLCSQYGRGKEVIRAYLTAQGTDWVKKQESSSGNGSL